MVLFVFFIEFYDRRLSFQAVRPLVFYLQHDYFLVSDALIGVSGLSKPVSVVVLLTSLAEMLVTLAHQSPCPLVWCGILLFVR